MPQVICFSLGESVTVAFLVIAGRKVMSGDDECKALNEATKQILEVSLINNFEAQEVATIEFLKKITSICLSLTYSSNSTNTINIRHLLLPGNSF